MDEFPIVIPTHHRPDGSTYRFFREFDPYVIVHSERSVPRDCPSDRVILQEEVGITPSRQVAVETFPKLILMDDDLTFSWRSGTDQALLGEKPTADDVYETIVRYLRAFPYVGVGSQFMSNTFPDGHFFIRFLRGVHGINQTLYPSGFSPRWRLRTYEDVDFAFQHIDAGIPPLTTTDITLTDEPGVVKGEINEKVRGGCNTWRTKEVLAADDEEFRGLWPGYVSSTGARLGMNLWKAQGWDLQPWLEKADAVRFAKGR